MAQPRFERFFRAAAGLDVDKEDLRRYGDFVNRKVNDLLVRAEAVAKANGRDLIEPQDLPITKGLQECMQRFERYDAEAEIEPTLEEITHIPQLDFEVSEATEQRIALVSGGISVALAAAFKNLDPTLKNPATEDWERAQRIFDLLL